jgi:pantoate--beta-alanine ligase
MQIIRTVDEMRETSGTIRRQGLGIGLVPTMGALHAGDVSLVTKAAERSEVVVVSIFVNPLQFGPGEDFERYPRSLSDDVEIASSAGAHIVFAPAVEEMYPDGAMDTRIEVGQIAHVLCGRSRPTHFSGVATVVAKLFHMIEPERAYFGAKDAQQIAVIRRMVRDLSLNVEVVRLPTVREPSGLALSSRNRYLTEDQHRQAAAISGGLKLAEDAYRGGERRQSTLLGLVSMRLRDAGIAPEYVELCAWDSLVGLPSSLPEVPCLLAVAARVGQARLIDNVVLTPSGGAPGH